MTPETAWQAGRFNSSRGPQRLLFGRMYEDAEIERAAFSGRGRIFCIASAGTTALALASGHEVVACDINPAQLEYARRAAEGAPDKTGDAERAMQFARFFMPVVGWHRRMLREFLSLENLHEQTEFWSRHLDTRRFRAAFDALLSRPVLRAAYAAPFLSFLPAKFGAILRKRLARGFSHHKNATNPFARSLLLGESDPHLSRANQNILFVLADAASWLESSPEGCFDGFALSNILDGAAPSYRERLFRAVRHAASDNAVVVLRSFAEPPADLAANLAECDRSLLWGIVDVCSARAF